MSYVSTNDPLFRTKIHQWISGRHEVLVLIRYSYAAGSKDFEFFDSMEAFDARLRELPPQTCITVFGEQQLPLRGRVNDEFITQALKLVPEGMEFVVTGLERVRYGDYAWYSHMSGETSAELKEDLHERNGELVAVGLYPPWLEDSEEVLSAVVPNADGSVTTGTY